MFGCSLQGGFSYNYVFPFYASALSFLKQVLCVQRTASLYLGVSKQGDEWACRMTYEIPQGQRACIKVGTSKDNEEGICRILTSKSLTAATSSTQGNPSLSVNLTLIEEPCVLIAVIHALLSSHRCKICLAAQNLC